jgi:hypothetical protein
MIEEQKREILELYKHGVRINSIPLLVGTTEGRVKRYLYKVLKVAKK